MRRYVLTILFIVGVFGFSASSSIAQIPAKLLQDPRQLLTALISALQTGRTPDLQQWLGGPLFQLMLAQTDGKGIYPPLRDLGPVTKIEITGPQLVKEENVYSANVVHQNGSARWVFGVNKNTARIETANFTPLITRAAPVTSPAVAPNADLVAACQRSPSLCDGGPGYAGNKPATEPRLVEFLFATTRKRQTNPTQVSFTRERGKDLIFGAAAVRIPEDHKIGRIELPRSWKLWGVNLKEEPLQDDKHFVVRKVVSLSEDEWGDIIREKNVKSALVFVHGFNTSFEHALYRNAQIVWDLQFPGLSVLFSWASSGEALDYLYDRDSAYNARVGFISLLKLLKEKHGIEHVNVLAHSMGNVVVLDALANNARTSEPVSIGELIMAAPDVDRDQFLQLAPEVRKIVKGMTLYASSSDKALTISRSLTGTPRAGDVPSDGPVLLPKIETIDVTAVGEELLGLNHNVFAATRALIDDIKIVLTTGQRPPHNRLSQIRPYPEAPSEPTYWRYAR